jgi:hypothetical protein
MKYINVWKCEEDGEARILTNRVHSSLDDALHGYAVRKVDEYAPLNSKDREITYLHTVSITEDWERFHCFQITTFLEGQTEEEYLQSIDYEQDEFEDLSKADFEFNFLNDLYESQRDYHQFQ